MTSKSILHRIFSFLFLIFLGILQAYIPLPEEIAAKKDFKAILSKIERGYKIKLIANSPDNIKEKYLFYLLVPSYASFVNFNVKRVTYLAKNIKTLEKWEISYSKSKEKKNYLLDRTVKFQKLVKIRGYNIAVFSFFPSFFKNPVKYKAVILEFEVKYEAPNVKTIKIKRKKDKNLEIFLKKLVLNPRDFENYIFTLPQKNFKLNSDFPFNSRWILRLQVYKKGYYLLKGEEILKFLPPVKKIKYFNFSNKIPWTIIPFSDEIKKDSKIVFFVNSEKLKTIYFFYSKYAVNPPKNFVEKDIKFIKKKFEKRIVFNNKSKYDYMQNVYYINPASKKSFYFIFTPGIINIEQYELSFFINVNNHLKNFTSHLEVNNIKITSKASILKEQKKIKVSYKIPGKIFKLFNSISFYIQPYNFDGDKRSLIVSNVVLKGKFWEFFPAKKGLEIPFIDFNGDKFIINGIFAHIYPSWLYDSPFRKFLYVLNGENIGLYLGQRKFTCFSKNINMVFLNQYNYDYKFFEFCESEFSGNLLKEIIKKYNKKYSYLLIFLKNLSEKEILDIFNYTKVNKGNVLIFENLRQKKEWEFSPNCKVFSFVKNKNYYNGNISDKILIPRIKKVKCVNVKNILPTKKVVFIYPEYFENTLRKFLKKRKEKKSVDLISIESIYDFFGENTKDKYKILEKYFQYVIYHSSTLPETFFFVGNANVNKLEDYFIPDWIPVYENFSNLLNSSDFPYGKIFDNAFYFSIMRLPVMEKRDLEIYLRKVKEYETSHFPGYANRLVYGVDDTFETYAKNSCKYIPAWFPIEPVLIKDFPERVNIVFGNDTNRKYTLAYKKFIDEMNRGCLLTYFSGHGGPTVLAHERLFLAVNRSDSYMNFLHNRPFYNFFVTLSCYSGKFFLGMPPFDESIAKALLFEANKGSIGAFLPVAEGIPIDQRNLINIFNFLLFKNRLTSLKDIYFNLCLHYILHDYIECLLEEYEFFGYPFLKIKIEKKIASDKDFEIKNKMLVMNNYIIDAFSSRIKRLKVFENKKVKINKETFFPIIAKKIPYSYIELSPIPIIEFEYVGEDSIKNFTLKDHKYYLKILVKNLPFLNKIFGKKIKLLFFNKNRKIVKIVKIKNNGINYVACDSILKKMRNTQVKVQLLCENSLKNSFEIFIPANLDISTKLEVYKYKNIKMGTLKIYNWSNRYLCYERKIGKVNIKQIIKPFSGYKLNIRLDNLNESKLEKVFDKVVFKNVNLTIIYEGYQPTYILRGDTVYLKFRIKNNSNSEIKNVRVRYCYSLDGKNYKLLNEILSINRINLLPFQDFVGYFRFELPNLHTEKIYLKIKLKYGIIEIESKPVIIKINDFPDIFLNKKDWTISYKNGYLIIKGIVKSNVSLPEIQLYFYIRIDGETMLKKVAYCGKSEKYCIKIPISNYSHKVKIEVNVPRFLPEKNLSNNKIFLNYDKK